jgi:large subunit ribosomal protein L21
MYAVIETGGKQYRVEVGTELQVDLIDAEPGHAITFDRVLLVGDGEATTIGRPVVADAAVEAEVLRRDRGEKLIVFKYRPKARTRTKKGHRQDHLVLRVTDVKLNNRSAAQERRKAEEDALTERERLQEAAARQAAADAELAAKLATRKAEAEGEAKPARSTRSGRRDRTPRARVETPAATDASAADAPAAEATAAGATDGDQPAQETATSTAGEPTTTAGEPATADATTTAGAAEEAGATTPTTHEPAEDRGGDEDQ